jgi:hypothetical protein
MRTSTLESKTIRPGLNAYSFYRSDRRPVPRAQSYNRPVRTRSPSTVMVGFVLGVMIVLAGFIGYRSALSGSGSASPNTSNAVVSGGQPVATSATNSCTTNNQSKAIIVNISQRHLWSCQGNKQVFDTPVITGIASHEDTRTPIGTYKIYAKHTNTTLTGKDSVSSWNDPVSYWMPFLNNKFGTYGLHDATWRPDSQFGKVDVNSGDASHGCVELPLSASKWLYDWVQVGTPVTIQP